MMLTKRRWTQLRKPIKNIIVTFGEHEGQVWGDVDRSYIEMLLASRKIEVEAFEDELNRRDLLEEADLPMAEQIVRAGYHALSQKHHPDHGGSDAKMRELNAAREGLKELLSMQQATP
jgi:hypothetical protein